MSLEEPKVKWRAPVKLIAISAVLILLGFGLCAGGFSLEGGNNVAVKFGMAAFWGGVLAFCVGFCWWIMSLGADS